MITQVDRETSTPSGGGGGITFDGTISVGEIAQRSGANTLGEYLYTHAGVTTATVGGLAAGTTLTNQKLAQIIDAMCYPYIGPSWSTFTINPVHGTYEFPLTPIASLTAIMTTVVGSLPITTVDLFFSLNGGAGVSQDNHAAVNPGGGAETFSDAVVPTPQSGVVNQVTTHGWYATVTDGTTTDSTVTRTRTYVYPFFYGSAAAGQTAQQLYTAFNPAGKIVKTKSNTTAAFAPVGQYYYFMYPAAYGALNVIYDQNGFNITADFTYRIGTANEDVAGLDTTSQPYIVYEFKNLTSLAQNLTFNF